MAPLELLLLLALYSIPVFVAWAVIYTAVLAALRRHDRDQAPTSS